MRGESLRITASQRLCGTGEDRAIERHQRLERDVGGFVDADVDDPHADALLVPAPADRRDAALPAALRRSVTIVSCRVG